MSKLFIHFIKFTQKISKKIKEDHVTAFSAQAAFFTVLSFFPFLLFFLTLARYLPFTKEDILSWLLQIIPSETHTTITVLVQDMYVKSSKTVLSASILLALWSASKGVLSVTQGLNQVYEINETRNYIILRLIACIYTVIFSFSLLLSSILIVFGKGIYKNVVKAAPFLANIGDLIIDIRMVLTVLILTLFFLVLYTVVPNRKTTFSAELPGAFISGLGWTFCSYILSIFIEKFTNFSYTYGSLSGIMVALLWLYFCMNILFWGAEINYNIANYKKHMHFSR